MTVQQCAGLGDVPHLSCRDDKAERPPESVGQHVYLGGQSASGTPQRLILGPLFRSPPAGGRERWCYRASGILDQGGEPVIPPRRHRKYQHAYDRIAYKHRWGIEGFFAKLKQWRRIATRYDKIAANFLGFVKLASIMFWLK